jgi:hypothetical protein
MKGWRPSAIQGLETGSGSSPRGRILAGHRIDRPVFARSSVPGFMTRGSGLAAAKSGRNAARASREDENLRSEKRRQPFTYMRGREERNCLPPSSRLEEPALSEAKGRSRARERGHKLWVVDRETGQWVNEIDNSPRSRWRPHRANGNIGSRTLS